MITILLVIVTIAVVDASIQLRAIAKSAEQIKKKFGVK